MHCPHDSYIITSPSYHLCDDDELGDGGETSYSLLVPISSAGALSFLEQGCYGGQPLIYEHPMQKNLVIDSEEQMWMGSEPAVAPRRSGAPIVDRRSVVRLKLRKHPTVDYGDQISERMSPDQLDTSGFRGNERKSGGEPRKQYQDVTSKDQQHAVARQNTQDNSTPEKRSRPMLVRTVSMIV